MQDINTVIAALQSGAPLLVLGAVLFGLVAFGKHPALAPQWQRIPAAYRPLVPAVLGVLGMTGELLLGGRGWLYAVIASAVTAGPAVLLALPSTVVPGRTVVIQRETDGSATIETEP